MKDSNNINPEMKTLYNRIIIGSIVLIASVSFYNNLSKDEVAQKETQQASEYNDAYYDKVFTDNAIRRVKLVGLSCNTLDNAVVRDAKDVTLYCNNFIDIYHVEVKNGFVYINDYLVR